MVGRWDQGWWGIVGCRQWNPLISNNDEEESYRVKANVCLANLPELHGNIPSVSIMNGPFGDLVWYGPDDMVYFAWHPTSPNLITHNVTEVNAQFCQHVISEFPQGYEKHIWRASKCIWANFSRLLRFQLFLWRHYWHWLCCYKWFDWYWWPNKWSPQTHRSSTPCQRWLTSPSKCKNWPTRRTTPTSWNEIYF